ncbi:MAG: hypothetical protein Q8P67_09290, partial [archaeon]|nr:hypothetical protein [archaeon]
MICNILLFVFFRFTIQREISSWVRYFCCSKKRKERKEKKRKERKEKKRKEKKRKEKKRKEKKRKEKKRQEKKENKRKKHLDLSSETNDRSW